VGYHLPDRPGEIGRTRWVGRRWPRAHHQPFCRGCAGRHAGVGHPGRAGTRNRSPCCVHGGIVAQFGRGVRSRLCGAGLRCRPLPRPAGAGRCVGARGGRVDGPGWRAMWALGMAQHRPGRGVSARPRGS